MGKWIFGILFGGVALVFIIAGAVMVYNQHALIANSQPMQATITASEVHTSTYTSKGRRRTRYTAAIAYDYTVSGKPYSSSNVYPGAFGSANGDTAHALVAKYPKGTIAQAYYDRRDPASSFLVKRHDFSPYLFILFPMIHLSIGVIVMVSSSSSKNQPPVARGAGKWQLPAGMPIHQKFNKCALLAGLWFLIGGLAIGHFFFYAERPYDGLPIWASIIYGAVGVIPLWMMLHFFNLSQKFSDATVTTDMHPAIRGGLLKVEVNLPVAGGGSIESATVTLVCKATVKTTSGGKTHINTSDIWKQEQPFTKAQDLMSDRILTGEVQYFVPTEQPSSSAKDFRGYPRHAWELLLHVKRSGPDYKARFPLEVS